jgi:hypothetical protein
LGNQPKNPSHNRIISARPYGASDTPERLLNKSSVGTADFDTSIYEIIPLLRNGKIPENQTIKSVLEDIAERIGTDGWKLKAKEKEKTLFDGL